MGLPAEDISATKCVIEAFGIRHATIQALITELDADRSRRVADVLAVRVGLRNRYQLAHLLAVED